MTRSVVAIVAVLLLGAVPAQAPAHAAGQAAAQDRAIGPDDGWEEALDAAARDRAIGPDDGWEEVLAAAARAAREGSYRGEAVWVSWDTGAPSATVVAVAQHDGVLEVRPLRADRGGLNAPAGGPQGQGGSASGDGAAGTGAGADGGAGVARVPEAARLTRKYEVNARGRAEVLARPCAVLDIHDRSDGQLRERLWVDVATGVLVRRESYHGDRLLRMAAFLSLDTEPTLQGRSLAPEPTLQGRSLTPGGADALARDRGSRGGPDRSSTASAAATPSAVVVEEAGIEALRAAGWPVPRKLPGGFELEEVHAHGGGGTPPLQMVYGDGLYVVSLFVQRGSPDFEALPDGAERADGLDFHAYEWPGSSPQRLVWSGDEQTFTLIGDAAPGEFRRIAEALPHASQDQNPNGWVERMRQRLGRWWSRLTG